MKLWNYIFIITGISILMAIAGLEVAGFTQLFNIIGLTLTETGFDPVVIDSALWSKIFGTSGLLVGVLSSTAIGIGAFFYTKDKSFLMIPVITGVFFYWISALISIINYAREYPVFGWIITIPLMVLTIAFIVTCVEWFLVKD